MEISYMTDFDRRSKSELRTYVVANRGDRKAFYKLVDRLKSDSQNTKWNSFPQTSEDFARIEEAIRVEIKKTKEAEKLLI
jgi:predicted transposase YbfD/YdcC